MKEQMTFSVTMLEEQLRKECKNAIRRERRAAKKASRLAEEAKRTASEERKLFRRALKKTVRAEAKVRGLGLGSYRREAFIATEYKKRLLTSK